MTEVIVQWAPVVAQSIVGIFVTLVMPALIKNWALKRLNSVIEREKPSKELQEVRVELELIRRQNEELAKEIYILRGKHYE